MQDIIDTEPEEILIIGNAHSDVYKRQNKRSERIFLSCRDGACPVSSPYNGILVTIRRWETEHAPSLHDVIWNLLRIT